MSLFCIKEGLRTLLVENTHSSNGSLGDIAFDQDPDKKFFSPYIKFKHNNIEYQIYAVPYVIEGKYHIIMIPMQTSPEDIENMIFTINDEEKKLGISHKIKKPSKIKLTYQNREVYAFNLSDERHFGYMT